MEHTTRRRVRTAVAVSAVLAPFVILWLKHPAPHPVLLRELTEAEQADEIAAKIGRDSIAIPSMDIHVSVTDRQFNSTGAMALPGAGHGVARFEAGARFDGKVGAVLVATSREGVLGSLQHLRPGSIIVTRGFDAARQWRVSRVGSYDSEGGITRDVFRGSFGARVLYLVTCEGALFMTGKCTDNVVATAVPTTPSTQ